MMMSMSNQMNISTLKLKYMMITTMTSMTRPGMMVSMSNQMNIYHGEAEVHDEHDHGSDDHDEAGQR